MRGPYRRDEEGGKAKTPSAIGRIVAGRVSALMVQRNLSMRHLAKRSGVSEGTIRRVLDGENVGVETLAQLAEGLRVDVAELVTRAA